MLSKEYLNTSRALLRIARNMMDQMIASRLQALSQDYKRQSPLGATVRRGSAEGPRSKDRLGREQAGSLRVHSLLFFLAIGPYALREICPEV